MMSIFATLLLSVPFLANETSHCNGIWSARGTIPFSIEAPESKHTNKEKSLKSDEYSVVGSTHGLTLADSQGRRFKLDLSFLPPLLEVSRSKDSKHIFVNGSDGGVVGTWLTYVYYVDGGQVVEQKNLLKEVRPRAQGIQQCDSTEPMNIGTVSWADIPGEILIVAEVPNHSSCANMGVMRGYRIEIKTGKIKEELSESSFRKKWKLDLGCRF